MYRQKPVYKCLRILYPDELREDLTNDLISVCKINPQSISIQIGIEEIARLCEHYIKQCNEFVIIIKLFKVIFRIPGLYGYNFSNKFQTLEKSKEDKKTRLPPVYKFAEDNRLSSEGLTLAEFDLKV